MPDVKIYIRAEDLDKWLAIEKKSEFIHNALNNEPKAKEPTKPATASIPELPVTYKKTQNWGA